MDSFFEKTGDTGQGGFFYSTIFPCTEVEQEPQKRGNFTCVNQRRGVRMDLVDILPRVYCRLSNITACILPGYEES